MTYSTPRRVLLGILLVCTGLPLFGYGAYMQTQPRTNTQDILAILACVVGMCLIGIGIGLPCTRTTSAIRFGMGFVFWGIVLAGLFYWGLIVLR